MGKEDEGSDHHLLSPTNQFHTSTNGNLDSSTSPSSSPRRLSTPREAETASLSPSEKISYYSFPNPESEHTIVLISRKISKQAGGCRLPCVLLVVALLLLLGGIVAISVCLAVVPFPQQSSYTLSSDDELLVQHQGYWISGLNTFGPAGVVVDQYIGAPPGLQDELKEIAFQADNVRIGDAKSEMFRYYLYPQSTINMTWNFGINSQIYVTLLRGKDEYAKFANDEEYTAIEEKDSDRDSLVHTVTQLEEYYVIIWSTAWVASVGSVSLDVWAKTFDRSNRVTSCQGNCTFALGHTSENYFLLIAPSRGTDNQVSTEYAVPFSEAPFEGKFLALYLTLGLFSFLLLLGIVVICVKQKPYRGWARL